jgi:hypothetical protein
MTSSPKEFLEEYFGAKRKKKETVIFLALTQSAFRDLSDEFGLRGTHDDTNIIDCADSIYVTPNDTIVITKKLVDGVDENFTLLPISTSQMVSMVLADKTQYYLMVKRSDGNIAISGLLHDENIFKNHEVALVGATRLGSQSPEVQKLKGRKDRIYAEVGEAIFGARVILEGSTGPDSLIVKIEDEDEDMIMASLDIEGAIKLRNGLNDFISDQLGDDED